MATTNDDRCGDREVAIRAFNALAAYFVPASVVHNVYSRNIDSIPIDLLYSWKEYKKEAHFIGGTVALDNTEFPEQDFVEIIRTMNDTIGCVQDLQYDFHGETECEFIRHSNMRWFTDFQFQVGAFESGAELNEKRMAKNRYHRRKYQEKEEKRRLRERILRVAHDIENEKKKRSEHMARIMAHELKMASLKKKEMANVHAEIRMGRVISMRKAGEKQEAAQRHEIKKQTKRMGRTADFAEQDLYNEWKKKQQHNVKQRHRGDVAGLEKMLSHISLDTTAPSTAEETAIEDAFEFQAGLPRMDTEPLDDSTQGEPQKEYIRPFSRCDTFTEFEEVFFRLCGGDVVSAKRKISSKWNGLLGRDDTNRDDMVPKCLALMEKVWLLYRTLDHAYKATDRDNMVNIMLLFASCNLDDGMSGTAYRIIGTILASADIDTVDEKFVNQAADFGDTMKDTWYRLRDSQMAARILDAITLAVSIIMTKVLGMKQASFDFLNYLKFSKSKGREGTVMEQIVDEMLFFIDKGIAFYRTGDVRSFFTDDSLGKAYDEEYAFLMGMMQNVEIDSMEKAAGISLSTYLARLEQCLEDTKMFAKKLGKQAERRFLVERMRALEKNVDTVRKVVAGRHSRIKPYGIMLQGRSGTGKTTVKGMLMKLIMLSNTEHFSGAESTICTMNGDDPYQSELTNAHQVVVLDDTANAMPAFSKGNPCQAIINILNNEPKAALKADLDGKGKVWYNCNLVVITTNMPSLHAYTYSAEPAAILRRFETVIEVTVKDDFRIDGSASIDTSKVTSLFTDVWNFRVYRNVAGEMGDVQEQVMTYDDDGVRKPMDKVNFAVLSKYLKEDTQRHFKSQAQLLRDQQHVHEMTLCEHGYLDKMCDHCDMVHQSGHITVQKVLRGISLIPAIADSVEDHIAGTVVMFAVSALILSMFTIDVRWWFVAWSLLIVLTVWNISWSTEAKMKEPAFKLEDCAHIAKVKYIAMGALSITGVVVMVKALMMIRTLMKTTSLVSQGSNASAFTDEKPVKSCWTVPIQKPTAVDRKLETMTHDQVVDVIKQKMAFAVFSEKSYSNAFPVRSNMWIINWHTVVKQPDTVSMYIDGESMVGANFTCKVHSGMFRRIGNTDLAVMYLPRGGSQKNMLRFFPETVPEQNGAGHFVYKHQNGAILEDKFYCQRMDIGSYKDYNCTGPGYEYTMSQDTFSGLCMGVLISCGKAPVILGFHFAGSSSNRRKGHAQIVTRQEVESTILSMLDDPDSYIAEVPSATYPVINSPEQGIFQNGKIHAKSPVHFLEKGTLLVYGDHTGHLTSYRSDVENTPIAETVARVCSSPVAFGPPKNMSNYKPKYDELVKITNTCELPWEAVAWAMKDFHNKIRGALKDKDHLKPKVCKIDEDVNLSGLDGVRGIDPINVNSSMGFPYNESKKKHVRVSERVVPGISVVREVDQIHWDRVKEMEQTLLRGERVYPVTKAHLKDEPKKIDSEKVRVFYGTPFAFLLLVRKYFLTIAKFYMDNPSIFETTVGMNVFGPEWNTMAQQLTQEQSDRIIGGDFRSWDSLMAGQMILCGGKTLMLIADWSGNFDRDDGTIMRGILAELSNPLIDFFGTVIEVSGCNTSGHSLTIILNDCVQKLYTRAAFYGIYKGNPPGPFHKYVLLRTNGDDNISTVKAGDDTYNHTSLEAWFAESGIVYTMADKEAASVPFVNLTDVDYLKRRFLWSGKHFRYHPALAKESVFKMLQVGIPSKVLTPEEACATNINTALQEMYYHGALTFQKFRLQMEEVVDIHELWPWFKDGVLRTYKECERFDCEQFAHGSQRPYGDDCFLEEQDGSYVSYKHNPVTRWDQNTTEWPVHGYQSITIMPYSVRLGFAGFWSLPRETPLFRGVFQHKNGIYLGVRDPDALDESRWIPTNSTTDESGNVTNNVATAQSVDKHQTLSFRDGAAQWISSIPNIFDRTRDVAMSDDVALKDFFERPVLIASFQWDPAAVVKFYQKINPWVLFYGNSRIVNRINNYHLLRSKLKVKIVINGNSFYYGRMMVDYQVNPGQDNVSLVTTGTTTAPLVSASQRLHLYLDPTESQGGVMCIPFISEYNNMVIPLANWSTQGVLTFREMNSLKHANGSVNPVSISVYAWAEDVKLSIPTKINCGTLVAQAGEYSDSPVQNMMSSIAATAGKLVMAPMIGPYAKATQIAAGAAGSIAKLMGYSRPVQIENHTVVRRQLIGPMANTDRGDTCTKLTVDSKQELTIDPRVMGIVPEDELSVAYIASKESYLTTFSWLISDRINTRLFNILMTPMVGQINGTFYHSTACAFAALPFKYWRGTMIYRFQIVASAYHRGRLVFVYEPRQQTGSPETQTQYSRIVDLTDERDFTMEVGWANDKTFQNVGAYTNMNLVYGTATQVIGGGSSDNGVLTVFVLNDLTSPSDTVNNDISINVFVRAKEDFEVAVPSDAHESICYMTTLVPQAGELPQETDDSNAPVVMEVKECVAKCLEGDNTYDVYFGEKISSMRQLLKRYNYLTTYLMGVTTTASFRTIDFDFPPYAGSSTAGRHSNAVNPVNNVTTTMLNYLAPAYVGYRGGIRYKFIAQSEGSNSGGRLVVVRNTTDTALYGTNSKVVNNTTTGQFADTTSLQASMAPGGEVTDLQVSPVLEVELPYYANRRFTWTRFITANFAVTAYRYLSHTVSMRGPATVNYIDKYVAVAEDFQLLLFQGQPPFVTISLSPV